MNPTPSFLMYFTQASPVVKMVMLMLLTASVFSWTFIVERGLYLKNIREAIDRFEEKFWSGIDMFDLYKMIDRNKEMALGLERMYLAGFREFIRLKQQGVLQSNVIIEGVRRSMQIAQAKEQDELEYHLPFLATVGSTSPYVGLFGTVWGIMTSFHALGNVQQATIAMVAPGISEALVATAMGLFAAIPAVIAYNKYITMAERIENRFETFKEELTNIIARQVNVLSTQNHTTSHISSDVEEQGEVQDVL